MTPAEYLEWKQFSDSTKSIILSQTSRIEDLIKSQMAIKFSHHLTDVKKFHRIFFEANRISFYGLIGLYKEYLKEYELEWHNLNPDFIKKLEELNQIRNDIAHGINPLENDFEHIKNRFDAPPILLHTYKKGELVIIEYSFKEIKEMIIRLDRILEVLFSQFSKIARQKDPDIEKLLNDVRLKMNLSSQDKTLQDSEP